MDIFSERLVELLNKVNVSQADFAKIIGKSFQVVSNYCNNRVKPSYEILYKICKEFGVSADYLMGLKDEE